ncbi:MAG: hypothetical protein IKS17_08255 [Firmicutes bacterium]|nr:hypothetical protein [Bacillota bacterium]
MGKAGKSSEYIYFENNGSTAINPATLPWKSEGKEYYDSNIIYFAVS